MTAKKPSQLTFDELLDAGPVAPPVYDELHASLRDWLGARTGSKREAYRNGPAQAAPSEGKGVEPSKRSLAERTLIVKDALGFLPLSRVETNSALRLLQDLGKPTSTVVYLNEAFRRQAKEGIEITDPRMTPQSIVRHFGGFAFDAGLTKTVLQDLRTRLASARPNLTMTDLQPEEAPLDTLLPIYRDWRVANAAKASPLDRTNYEDMGNAMDIDYMGAELTGPLHDAVSAFAGRMTVKVVRDRAQDIIDQQNMREAFWQARVDEAYRHIPSRDMVNLVHGVDARTYY